MKYLGIPRHRLGMAEREDQVGIVTGLAWTEMGGELLTTEATVMPGKGKLIITGKLGEVMQESAQAAMSYVRARAERFGIDKKFTENCDIHVHLPEGAIPKDGPSAGVTMCTALLSSLAKIPVRKDVAMTGEITLRGRVLPIGGLKEKVLAAHRAGIKTVIIPKENRKDLKEIPKKIRAQLRIVRVEFVDEVLREALVLENPDEFLKRTKSAESRLEESRAVIQPEPQPPAA
jgi:ATP-dependent Lon protease